MLLQLLAAISKRGMPQEAPQPTKPGLPRSGPITQHALPALRVVEPEAREAPEPTPVTVAAHVGLPRNKSVQAVYDAVGDPDDLIAAFDALTVSEKMELIEAEVAALPDHEKRVVIEVLRKDLDRVFLPFPGPQTQALVSKADILLYGGAAGGGKSKLLLGCAAEGHKRALIVRRESTELDGLISESQDMLRGRGDLNKSDREWSLANGASIKFGGMKDEDSWRSYAGRARDFMGFDEAAEFLEEQVSSLIGWLRSTDPDQRCRVVLASNPPRGAEGQWLVEWFAPWLDPSFPDPAKPGDLRWCIVVGGETRWLDDVERDGKGRPVPILVEGETYTPLSRTYIPARLDDNPALARTNYRAGLQNLPEPLRSQLLKGDFLAGREDDAWQVIPSEWIEAAQARWTPHPPVGQKMTSLGVDVAQGGADETVLAPRHGTWFAPLRAHKGIDTKDGPAVAGLVFATMRDGCEVVVDLGGGWGGSAFDHLKHQEIAVTGVVPSAAATTKSREGLGFINARAEMWWHFREALDPNGGAYIALPPDPALVADLTMPRWKLAKAGIQIEAKDEIRKRLGRSPDRGDAVVMAWAHGSYREKQRATNWTRPSTANVGYASTKRRRA